MAKRRRKIDPRVALGRIHLPVRDLDRSLAFYEGVLGFEVTRLTPRAAAVLTDRSDRPRVLLSVDEEASGTGSACSVGVRYPTRPALADALRRVEAGGVSIVRATGGGTTESLHLRDPDGHQLELYRDLPREEWPRDPDAAVQPLDLAALRSVADEDAAAAEGGEVLPPLSDATRSMLRDMRVRLLNLHKVLLEDAKAAYEMDRGRIGSNAGLLQLVINDPWFAWLHPLSELVVRIDEALQTDAPAAEADGTVLLEQVARLLSPEQGPVEFARRYYEALQRQPAVIVAHAEVRRILKQSR
jgi:catechol 2,3-dioxygenase-like lactoylglutathione lyase family enzyme